MAQSKANTCYLLNMICHPLKQNLFFFGFLPLFLCTDEIFSYIPAHIWNLSKNSKAVSGLNDLKGVRVLENIDRNRGAVSSRGI